MRSRSPRASGHRPIPFALFSRQSGDTSTRMDAHAEQRKRGALAIAGNSASGVRPIAAKAMGVDRRQTGLQQGTHAPATPWDWRSAIVGGAMVTAEGSVAKSVAGDFPEFPISAYRALTELNVCSPNPAEYLRNILFLGGERAGTRTQDPLIKSPIVRPLWPLTAIPRHG